MYPAGINIQQGPQNERPFMRAGMRQHQVRCPDHLPSEIDDVEVECPGRIDDATLPAGIPLDLLQSCKQFERIDLAGQSGDTVYIRRLV